MKSKCFPFASLRPPPISDIIFHYVTFPRDLAYYRTRYCWRTNLSRRVKRVEMNRAINRSLNDRRSKILRAARRKQIFPGNIFLKEHARNQTFRERHKSFTNVREEAPTPCASRALLLLCEGGGLLLCLRGTAAFTAKRINNHVQASHRASHRSTIRQLHLLRSSCQREH